MMAERRGTSSLSEAGGAQALVPTVVPRPLEGLPMSEDTTANRAASLHSTAIDLSEVAAGLADVSTDDGIGKLARILDRIAEEARRIVTQRNRVALSGRASATRSADGRARRRRTSGPRPAAGSRPSARSGIC